MNGHERDVDPGLVEVRVLDPLVIDSLVDRDLVVLDLALGGRSRGRQASHQAVPEASEGHGPGRDACRHVEGEAVDAHRQGLGKEDLLARSTEAAVSVEVDPRIEAPERE